MAGWTKELLRKSGYDKRWAAYQKAAASGGGSDSGASRGHSGSASMSLSHGPVRWWETASRSSRQSLERVLWLSVRRVESTRLTAASYRQVRNSVTAMVQ